MNIDIRDCQMVAAIAASGSVTRAAGELHRTQSAVSHQLHGVEERLGTALFLPALFTVGDSGTLGVAIAGLVVFGLGWGFFDSNNMPILSQIARPEWRATGYGIMNMVSISLGGFGDWAFGALRDRDVPLNVIFGVFAGVALLSVLIVLMIRPRSGDAVRVA